MMWLWFQMIGPNNWMLAPANVQTFEEGPNTFIIACCSLSTIDVLVLVLTELYQYSGISLQKKTSLLATSDNILYSLFGIARPPHMSWFCNKESSIPAVWCLLLAPLSPPFFDFPMMWYLSRDLPTGYGALWLQYSGTHRQEKHTRGQTQARQGPTPICTIYMYIYTYIYTIYIIYVI